MKKQSLKNILTSGLIIAGIIGLTACNTTSDTQVQSNREKAVAVISSIETGAVEPINYINANDYTQHNLSVGDGLEGFGAVMQMLPKGSAKAQVKRSFQDGEYVVTHTEYNFFGPKAGFDLFRFENGQIVEHWDNLQTISPANASGHTQFDGTTEINDLDKTDLNKSIVKDFVETILIKGDMSKIATFIDPDEKDYIQHNPAVADGLTGLGEALGALAKQGMPMSYTKNHKIVGEGNFVLSISEGVFLKEQVAFYDLFRLQNNKIVEHWDTIETIPAKANWKNPNGKFNF